MTYPNPDGTDSGGFIPEPYPPRNVPPVPGPGSYPAQRGTPFAGADAFGDPAAFGGPASYSGPAAYGAPAAYGTAGPYGGAPMGTPVVPFGFDPATGLPYSDKSKLAAGLLSIFLGFFGVGRFYMGHNGLGLAQLLVNIVLTVVTLGFWLGAAWIWPLVDGIVILAGQPRDGSGRPLR